MAQPSLPIVGTASYGLCLAELDSFPNLSSKLTFILHQSVSIVFLLNFAPSWLLRESSFQEFAWNGKDISSKYFTPAVRNHFVFIVYLEPSQRR